ncbi:DUF1665 domain containing protein [Colletotrichum musicola]|uniref:DUF1665 domain containing protein n=1 Tax=Colletotrichum musicola TaxID=2175873 RepID=A0A8H6KNL2_9PEZI|nr:DUF1665 domain containing protein [Colletotrichum musicola]
MKSRSKTARAGRTIREQTERMMARLRFPDDHFPVAVDDWTQSWPHTNRERCMVAFMDEITVEENWAAIVFDDASINAWKADVMGRETQNWQARKVGHRHPTRVEGGFSTSGRFHWAVSAYKSDWKPAEENLDQKPEWVGKAESEFQRSVANLIDPDLYALINGRSRVLLDKEIGLNNCLGHIAEGITVPEVLVVDDMFRKASHVPVLPWSPYSQLLSCEVRFPDGQNAKIVSYVNNIHPQDHADVYPLLEKIITKAMPLWNLVYCTIYRDTMRCDVRILCDEFCRVFPGQPDDLLNMKTDMMNALIEDDEFSDEDEWIDEEEWRRRKKLQEKLQKGQIERRLEEHKVVKKPEPGTGKDRYRDEDSKLPTAEAVADYTTMLGGAERIQVIVKLMAMYLTPEHPVCELPNDTVLDGAWNDHIAATAVYFFDDENVTDAKMSFQSQVDDDFTDCFTCVDADPGDMGLDELFGHRKVLTLHLVDPRVRVLSTANVPPQRTDWWAREFSTSGGQFKCLPKEVVDMVVDNVMGFPIHRDEAVQLRKERLATNYWEIRPKVKTCMNYRRVASA